MGVTILPTTEQNPAVRFSSRNFLGPTKVLNKSFELSDSKSLVSGRSVAWKLESLVSGEWPSSSGGLDGIIDTH